MPRSGAPSVPPVLTPRAGAPIDPKDDPAHDECDPWAYVHDENEAKLRARASAAPSGSRSDERYCRLRAGRVPDSSSGGRGHRHPRGFEPRRPRSSTPGLEPIEEGARWQTVGVSKGIAEEPEDEAEGEAPAEASDWSEYQFTKRQR